MILLSIDEIVLLQQKLVDKTGGAHGLRDYGLLESAVNSANAGYGDTEVYPSVFEKAARLAFAITKNHAFFDGNKRIGIFVMLMTVKLNGYSLSYLQNELIDLGLGIAAGNVDYEKILKWLQTHLK